MTRNNSRRRRLLVLGVGATALALTLASCGVPTDKKARSIPASQVPFELLAPATSTTASTAPAPTSPTTVYFVFEDRLVPVTRNVVTPVTPGSVLATLVQGPTAAEEARGLRSRVDSQTKVENVQLNGGTALINLSEAFSGIGVQNQIVAVAQLVYTATALQGVSNVQILLESRIVEVPRGDGTLTHDPLTRADYAAFAPRS